MLLSALLTLAAVAPEDPGKCEYGVIEPWFVDSDYPASARARGQQGAVSYLLQVDAEGCTVACEIVDSSGFPELDAATCPALMRRARFKAARNAAGERVPARYAGAHFWMIPEPLPSGFTPPQPRGPMSAWVTGEDYPGPAMRARQQGEVGFRLEVSAAGKVDACTIWLSSGVPSLDAVTCSLMMRRARFTPARDEAGNAVPGIFADGIAWTLPPE